MAAIVKSWGLDGRTVKILEEQEIDEQLLAELDEATIKELFPIIGLRNAFLKKWRASYGKTAKPLPVDVIKIQEDRVAFVKRLGLSDQPFIIAVGPNLTTISSFYVSIDKVLYQVNSALTALNVCFKAFHALDAEYPIASQHLWLLIQKGLYNFTTKWDKSISYVEETLGMISNLKKATA